MWQLILHLADGNYGILLLHAQIFAKIPSNYRFTKELYFQICLTKKKYLYGNLAVQWISCFSMYECTKFPWIFLMVRQTTPDIIYVFRRNFQVKVISSIFHIGKMKTSFSPKNIFHQIKLLVIFSVKKLLSQNFCKNCELRNGKRKLISQSYNFKFQ